MTPNATTIPNAIAMRGPRDSGGAGGGGGGGGGEGSVVIEPSRWQMLPPAAAETRDFQGMMTANCCIAVDFAASKPGAPAGPSTWTTTRYALVLVQMWVMRSAKSAAPVPVSSWLL